jgi:hypothetical protein
MGDETLLKLGLAARPWLSCFRCSGRTPKSKDYGNLATQKRLLFIQSLNPRSGDDSLLGDSLPISQVNVLLLSVSKSPRCLLVSER